MGKLAVKVAFMALSVGKINFTMEGGNMVAHSLQNCNVWCTHLHSEEVLTLFSSRFVVTVVLLSRRASWGPFFSLHYYIHLGKQCGMVL